MSQFSRHDVLLMGMRVFMSLLLINDLLQTAHAHWGSPKLIHLHV